MVEVSAAPVTHSPRLSGRLIVAGAAVLLAATLLAISRTETAVDAVAINATPEQGSQSNGEISPDGRRLIFRSHEKGGTLLKVRDLESGLTNVISPPLRSLIGPRWSPDGSSICFTRRSDSQGAYDLWLSSSDGQNARQLTTIRGIGSSWASDSRSILVTHQESPSEPHAVFQVSVATGEWRRLSFPPKGSWGDVMVAAAPAGDRFAIVRYVSPGYGDIYISSWNGEEVRRLTWEENWVAGVAFSADGSEIVFPAGGKRPPGLYRLNLRTGAEPRLIPGTGGHVRGPSISRGPNSVLAFEHVRANSVVRAVEHGFNGRDPAILLSPGFAETPAYSPDGRRIAFMSSRNEVEEIWIANSDGSSPAQLTSLGRSKTREPAWSPDSQWIAFTSAVDGKRAIHVVRSTGGTPYRLTSESYNEGAPAWSRDGRFVYFRSDRSGTPAIYRTRYQGGTAPANVVANAVEARESPDGSHLYFVRNFSGVRIWSKSLTGDQQEKQLDFIPRVEPGHWGVVRDGIFYLDLNDKGPWSNFLRLYRFSNGRTETHSRITTHRAGFSYGCDMSPDGRVFLLGHSTEEIDMHVIRAFR